MSTKWRSLALILWLSLYASLAPAQQPSWETLNTAGMYAYNQGQYPKAKRLFCEALDSLESTSQADPRLVHTLNNLGAAQEALGEYEQAELSYRQSLTIVEKIQGSDHPDLVLGLNNLASLYFTQGQYPKAVPLLRRGLGILERLLGPEHPHLVQILKRLAVVTQAQRRYDQAEEWYARAIRITEKTLGPYHPHLATILDQYAGLLRQSNRDEEAKMVEKQAAAIRAHNIQPGN